jgi:O-methyltransferase domain/Dimerisation domain
MDTPPPVQMVQLLAGFQVSQALYAAAKIGLPDQLADGPQSITEAAAFLQTDPTALSRLANSLTGLGVLRHTSGDSYELTPLGETLRSDSPGSMRNLALMWMETHYGPFGGLAETVRTGTSAAETYYGMPFFEWLATEPEQAQRFSGAMANLTDGIKIAAIHQVDLGDAERIIDLGGADGSLLVHVLTDRPGATAVCYDLPHVVPAVTTLAKGAGLEDRLTGQGGDFFADVPSGFDSYLMSMVLHDWDDQHAATLLANIARTAESGARVRAVELVLPGGDEPHMAKMIDLTMLGMLNGRERTEPEFRQLFEASGLQFKRIVPTPTPLSIIEARVR